MMLQSRLFVLILSLCVCFAAKAADVPPDIQRILSQHKLIVAVLQKDTPPFFMHDQKGNLVGSDISLAQNLAQRLGVTLEFNQQATTFDEVVDLIANGKADVGISLLSRTLPRAMKISFSQPYRMLSKAFVVNRLQAAQRNLETNLEEKLPKIKDKSIRIGVLANSSYVHFANERYTNLTIVPYESLTQALQDLQQNKIFGIFFDTLQLQNLLSKIPDSAIYFKIIPLKMEPDSIAIGVPWHDTHLLRWINLYLDVITVDGTLARINQKYIQELPS